MQAPSNKCRTQVLGDDPAEKDEFGQHEKVAGAIRDMITEERDGRAVALFGGWGSGKSTVVRILKNMLAHDQSKHVFVFDAWAHQGDPLRRAFLERLILSLSSRLWLVREDWQATLEGLAHRLKVVTSREVPRLTRSGVAILFAALLAPAGLAILSGTMIPFRSRSMYLGALLAFLPLLGVLISRWLKDPQDDGYHFANPARGPSKRKDFLSFFVSRSDTVTRNETTETPDPTSLEFNDIFTRLLHVALGNGDRKLAIVIDNLDRVAAADALAIWSTMRTFFEHRDPTTAEAASRIWLIVPFDRSAADKLWLGKDDVESCETGKAFIQKTFQVSFHVSPPVVSRLTKYLTDRLAEAFPDHQDRNDFQQIYDLFLIMGLQPGKPVTPREVKLFINKLGALHRQWQDRIPLPHQALYVLCQDSIEKEPQRLTAPNFPESTALEVVETKDVKLNLAALHFGVDPKNAWEVLIGPDVRAALVAGDPAALKKLENTEGFQWVLLTAVREACQRPHGEEPKYIALAALACSELQLASERSKLILWERLRRAAQDISGWRDLDPKTALGITAIIKNTAAQQMPGLVQKVASTISTGLGIENPTAAKEWAKGALLILKDIEQLGLLAAAAPHFSIPGMPPMYLAAVEEFRATTIPSLQALLRPFCGTDAVVEHLSTACKAGNFDQETLLQLQTIANIPLDWNFDPLVQSMDERIVPGLANLIERKDAPLLVSALTTLAISHNSKRARDLLISACRRGKVLDLLSHASKKADHPVLAQLVLTFLEFNPDLGVESHAAESQYGQQFVGQLLSNPASYSAVINECATLIFETGRLEWLLQLCRDQRARAFAEATLKRLCSQENGASLISSDTFLNHFDTLRSCLPEETLSSLVRGFANEGSLGAALLQAEFKTEWAPAYRLLLESRQPNNTALEAHVVKGLCALPKDTWTSELATEGEILWLLFSLLEQGREPELKSPFENALTDYTKAFAANKKAPSKLRDKWHLLPRALARHLWTTFSANLLDWITPLQPEGREAVLLLFGADLFPPNVATDEASQIVRGLFKKVVETRRGPELDWLQRTLAERGDILKGAHKDYQQSLQDELRAALAELPDGLVKARVRGILHLSSVRAGAASTDVAGEEQFALLADASTLYGKDIFIEAFEGKLSIGHWTRSDDFPEWSIQVARQAVFNVSLEYACAPDHGGDFVMTVGDQVLRGIIASTKGWDKFESTEVGQVQIGIGNHSVTIKHGPAVEKALMNLRCIRFTPA